MNKYCKRNTFGCILYLALLTERNFRLSKYITKCHEYMYKNCHIQDYTISNLRQLVPKLISAKYCTHQVLYTYSIYDELV